MSGPFTVDFSPGLELNPITGAGTHNQRRMRSGESLSFTGTRIYLAHPNIAANHVNMIEMPVWAGTNIDVSGDPEMVITLGSASTHIRTLPRYQYAGQVPYVGSVDITNNSTDPAGRRIYLSLMSCNRAGTVFSQVATTYRVFAPGETYRLSVTGTVINDPFIVLEVKFYDVYGWVTGDTFRVENARVDWSHGLSELDFFWAGTNDPGATRTADTPTPYWSSYGALASISGRTNCMMGSGATCFRAVPETINYWPNPYGTTNVSRTAANATPSIVAESPYASNCYRLTATGANARDRGSITVPNGERVSFIGIVFNRSPGSRTATLAVAGSPVASATVEAGTMEILEGVWTGTGAPQTYDVSWANSVASDVFDHWYVGVLSAGGFRMGPAGVVPDLGLTSDTAANGSWAGTAHDSVFTRNEHSVTYTLGLESDGYEPLLSYEQGTVVIWLTKSMREITSVTRGPQDRVLLALDDVFWLGLAESPTGTIQFAQNLGSGIEYIESADAFSSLSDFVFIYEWAGSLYSVEGYNQTAQTAIARVSGTIAGTRQTGNVTEVTLGNRSGGGSSAGALIAGAMGSRRLLTDMEKADLYAGLPWPDVISGSSVNRMDLKALSSNRIGWRRLERELING